MSNTARSYPVRGKSLKKKSSFLPEHFKGFLSSRVIDLLGVFIVILGGLLVVCLLSYHPADPSMNSATTIDSINNLLGISGAYIADLFLQSFGVVSMAFPLMLMFSGFRIFKRSHEPRLWLKITVFLVGVIVASMAFSAFPTLPAIFKDIYLGGSVGVTMLNGLTELLQSFDSSLSLFSIGMIMMAIAVICFSYVAGMSRHHWLYAGHRVFSGSSLLLSKATSLLRNNDVQVANIPMGRSDGKKSKKSFKAPPIVKTRKTVDVKESIRAVKEKQPELKLQNDGEDWQLPALSFLDEPPVKLGNAYNKESLQRNAELLQNILNDFGVEGTIVAVNPGPIITLYELEPAPGTKSSRVINLAEDIARSMSTTTVRVAVIPGKNAIGIELPNKNREMVYLKELLSSQEYENSKAKLPLILGKTIAGDPVIADLAKMPHLLVAGTTGSGKSVGINTMILSILYKFSPEQCRLIMIDPKMLELSVYDDIPHLLTPVVTEPHKAVTALKWAVGEMEDRYRLMSKLGVRNHEGYNTRIRAAQKTGEVIMNRIQTGFDHQTGKPVFEEQAIPLVEMPLIVIIVDEFADLMLVAGKEVEVCIQRLAQMARAAGIHLIMATQRPSVDVITGIIKANFPTRISFQVTSKIDSRTILGEGGAEQLLGRGDMLFMGSGEKIKRVHGPFVDDAEVEQVVTFLKEQGEPEYVDSVTLPSEGDDVFKGISSAGEDYDELYDQALSLVLREQKASTSFVQRHLQIGYNRAARIIEKMESDGVIGAANHVGKREILMEDHTGAFDD